VRRIGCLAACAFLCDCRFFLCGLPPIGETRQICTTCRLIVNDRSAGRSSASWEADGEAEASSAGEQLAKE